jgi:ABC-type nitrate/sulfonate/bicarbonate transport system substrate-binding protein
METSDGRAACEWLERRRGTRAAQDPHRGEPQCAIEPANDLLAVREQPVIAALQRKASGAPTRLVGLAWTHPFQAVLVHADSRIRRVRDLRDRRIGLAGEHTSLRRAQALRGAITALEAHGLYHRHVAWVDVPGAASSGHDESLADSAGLVPAAYRDELNALRQRAVDAVYVHGAAGRSALRAPGVRLLFDLGATRDPWVRLNSAALVAFTVDQASVESRLEQIARALAARLGSPSSGQSKAAGPSLDLGDRSREALCLWQRFLLRWGVLSSESDLGAWIDPGPLAAAHSLLRTSRVASRGEQIA